MQRRTTTKGSAAPRLGSKVGKLKGEKSLEKKHLAIRNEDEAGEWVAKDAALMVYVRALSAAQSILEHARAAEPLMKERRTVEAKVAKLRKAHPGFEISMRPPPPPPPIDASLAQDIVGGYAHPFGTARVHELSEFLEKSYATQCTERYGLRWRAPTKRRGKDGIYTSTGRLEKDQLARVIMAGVATLLDLRSLERSELPIVAVAAGFETTAEQSDETLPVEFERRADAWRQESDVVAQRLLTLLPSRYMKQVWPSYSRA